jgi:hypothetical protein
VRVCSWRDHRAPTKVLELSFWLYAALLLCASGSGRTETHLQALRSTEGVPSSLHAAPPGSDAAGLVRPASTWSGVRAPIGSALPSEASWSGVPQSRSVRMPAPLQTPDVTRFALGFLSDHSLAPPPIG